MGIEAKKMRRARRGQILIPSLLVIPSLLLFVYLLFETTKLSREKIRQQFAVDSAAFIQMSDYTNLLNRTAYVNGAFPYRIFKEAYECPGADGTNVPLKKTDDTPDICAYDMLYQAGAFPKYKNDVAGALPSSLDGEVNWKIEFDNTVRPEFTNNPTSQVNKALFTLITKDQGQYVYVDWDSAIGYYKFYAQVYGLLGSVEEAQWTVFERLTDSFSFFRKSYYLNANTSDCVSDPGGCGEEGLHSGGGFYDSKLVKGSNFFMHFIQAIEFYAKVYTGGSLPPYYLGHTATPIDMTSMAPDGLFQLATVEKSRLKKLGDGLDVFQGWDPPSNYFNVDFTVKGKCSGMDRPCVHALVATQCPGFRNYNGFTEDNNCVWPSPTPKYQTRLYP